MNGNCHFVYGAAVGTALTMNLDKVTTILPQVTNTSETATLFILGGLLGGIFPDIDNESSHIGKLSAPVSTVIGFINEFTGKTGTNHRGILHDPIIYLIGLVLCYLYFPPMVGFFIGCLSHIFLDLFNPKGVPILVFKQVHIANFRSGEIGSIMFTWVCVILVIFIGCMVKFIL